jgi:hypothetical protein
MITVVLKPFTAYGVPYERGEIIDSTDIRNEGALLSARMIRAATPQEYAEATGTQTSFPSGGTPPKGKASPKENIVEEEFIEDDSDNAEAPVGNQRQDGDKPELDRDNQGHEIPESESPVDPDDPAHRATVRQSPEEAKADPPSSGKPNASKKSTDAAKSSAPVKAKKTAPAKKTKR